VWFIDGVTEELFAIFLVDETAKWALNVIALLYDEVFRLWLAG